MNYTRLDYGSCDNPEKRLFNGVCIYLAQFHHHKCLLSGKMCHAMLQLLAKEYAEGTRPEEAE